MPARHTAAAGGGGQGVRHSRAGGQVARRSPREAHHTRAEEHHSPVVVHHTPAEEHHSLAGGRRSHRRAGERAARHSQVEDEEAAPHTLPVVGSPGAGVRRIRVGAAGRGRTWCVGCVVVDAVTGAGALAVLKGPVWLWRCGRVVCAVQGWAAWRRCLRQPGQWPERARRALQIRGACMSLCCSRRGTNTTKRGRRRRRDAWQTVACRHGRRGQGTPPLGGRGCH